MVRSDKRLWRAFDLDRASACPASLRPKGPHVGPRRGMGMAIGRLCIAGTLLVSGALPSYGEVCPSLASWQRDTRRDR